MTTRQKLRQSMRNKRRTLSHQQQAVAAKLLSKQVNQLDSFKLAKNIALYLAVDGEISTREIINQCWNNAKQVYLPVLDPDNHNQLLFVNYDKDTPMILNKYGIQEPSPPYQKTIDAADLDLIFLPLVAFDDTGARMGMGGGYYDRSFAFTSNTKSSVTLIGLSHALQQVDKLAVESWDIPLAGIVTDKETHSIT